MRRIVSGILLATFLTQSSGASALAASTSGRNPFTGFGDALVAVVVPLHNAWLNSALHAAFAGEFTRYQAMHAPRPTIPHVIRITKPPYAGRWHEARFVRRSGTVARVPGLHRPQAIDPRKAPRDPMALRRSVAPGTSTAHSGRGTVAFRFTPRFNARGRFATGGNLAPLVQQTPTSAPIGAPVNCPLLRVRGQLICCNPPCPTLSPPPTPTPTPPPPTPTPTPSPTPSATPTSTPTPAPGANGSTGINHYWTYEEEPLPGIGRAIVNVGNGNAVIQVDDLDIPERGIDLAFRRTYNSQSEHDASGTNGSTPSVFGNGWTNTLDAHLAYNATSNIISVYDIDGARYDFCANGQGGWQSCTSAGANNYTMLTSDGACGYYWTKKTGTAYYFEAPNQPSTCGTQIPAGLSGRVLAIQGRNVNNSLTFTYSWVNGDATNPENLTQIAVAHSDGQSVTLTFGLLNGTGPDELQSITRPDSATISYEYDSAGNLLEVDRPGNVTTNPQCSSANTDCIPETYTYNTGGYQLATANLPRYTVSQRNNGTAQEGDTVNFAYDGSRRIASMTDYGVVNFTPSDGTSTVLQASEPTGLQSWYSETFSGYGTGTTTVSDSDGHARSWTVDSLWRVTQTREWLNPNFALVSNETWDSNDNLTSFTDERNNTTVASYDANGNTIMEAQPPVTVSVNGSLVAMQPTAWYQYDSHNNLTYYCDPLWSHGYGGDYPNGSDPCTGAPSGVAHYTWDLTDPNEPFGRLSETTTAMGDYHEQFSYNADGMPTSVTGDTFQEQNGNTVQPEQQFVYDGYGNLICYSNLTDSGGTHWWRLSYDSMNRQTAVADPDDASLTVPQCSNTPGLPGSHIQTTTTYFADGEVASKQTPSEYADNYSSTYTYDVDGDELSETHHFNCTGTSCTAGTATKWYDGDDRVVEVLLPHDTSDYWSRAWMTRYLYDLTQGGTVTIPIATGANGTSPVFHAYGDLFGTEEYLSGYGNSGWPVLKGTAYDALDRAITQYQYSPMAGTDHLEQTAFAFDSSPQTYGLLASKTDALGEVTAYTYDADARVTNVSYSGDGGVTPAEEATYDPDGRAVAVQSSTLGAEQYFFDADSRLTESIEPPNLPSAARLNYAYYPNGWRSAVSVTSSALTQNNLLQYNYRNDGQGLSQFANYGSSAQAEIADTDTPTGRPQSASYGTYSSGSGGGGSSGGNGGTGGGWNLATRSFTYDTYARLSTDSAGGGFSAFNYDAEGDITAYTSPYIDSSHNLTHTTATVNYTVRGELQKQTWSNYTPPGCDGLSPPAYGPSWFAGTIISYANGYPIASSQNTCSSSTQYFDPLTSAGEGSSDSTGQNAEQLAYDTAGRQSSAAQTYYGSWMCGDTQCVVSGSGSYSKSYDAEDHLLGQTYTGWQDYGNGVGCPANTQLSAKNWSTDTFSLQYVWGPSGHVVEAGSGAGYETIHWDGDTVLFTTNPSGALDDIKLGSRGPLGISSNITITNGSATVVFTPRDFTGAPVMSDPPSPTRLLCYNGANTPTFYPGPDGISDGYNIFQGVRSYDPVAGTWNSPDAYQGEVGDPMSQKSYIWDNNNSFAYADASGYAAQPPDPTGFSMVQTFIEQLQSEFDDLTADQSSEVPDHWGAKQALNKIWAKVKATSFGYRTLEEAAQQAAFDFAAVTDTYHVEVGCVLYCTSGGCGFFAPVAGAADDISDQITESIRENFMVSDGSNVVAATGDKVTEAGYWHTHRHAIEADLGYHAMDAQALARIDPHYEVFTSVMGGEGTFWETLYNGVTRCVSGPCPPPAEQ